MSRRKSRIIAFQALYSWDVSKESVDDILSFSWLQKDSEIKEGVEHDFSDSEKEEQKSQKNGDNRRCEKVPHRVAKRAFAGEKRYSPRPAKDVENGDIHGEKNNAF